MKTAVERFELVKDFCIKLKGMERNYLECLAENLMRENLMLVEILDSEVVKTQTQTSV